MKRLNKDYWLYWIASAAGMAASNILQYVLSLYVLEVTGSATLFASMLSITIFPRIFLTPIAGVLADRVKKIRFMSWVLLGEVAVLGLYGIFAQNMTLNLIWIYVLVIVLEIGEIFYEGSASAILPELVEKDKLKEAISVSKIDDGIVVVIAPMTAALLYEKLSLAWAFLIVAGLNLLAFALQSMIRPRYEVTKENMQKNTFWVDFKEGIATVRKDEFLRGFVMVLPIADAFFGATFSVSVMYLLRETYQLNAYIYGIYLTVTACMSMISPVLVVPLVKKYPAGKIYSVATGLIAIEIAGIGVFALLGVQSVIPVFVSVVAITILDCMTILEAIPMQMSSSVLLQTNVKKELLGRVTSVVRMVSVAAVALGEMLFGFLNDTINVWVPIFIGAVGVAVASVLYGMILKKVK